MASFPSILSGACFMYPLQRTNTFRTKVHRFVDFSEQRYAMGSQLTYFSLEYTNLTTLDKESLRSFFTGTLGEWDTTWDITVDGIQYKNMQFVGSRFTAEEKSEGLWNVSLRCRQTRHTADIFDGDGNLTTRQ